MPLPQTARMLESDVTEVGTQLTAVATALSALPATPLEADLPDIVQIVADLGTSAEALQSIVAQILTVLSTTRVNQ